MGALYRVVGGACLLLEPADEMGLVYRGRGGGLSAASVDAQLEVTTLVRILKITSKS